MPARRSPARPGRRTERPRAGGTDAVVAEGVDAIRRIVRALRLAEHEGVATVGMSAAQLFVLRQLAEVEAASLTDLAARTMTDRTSVAAVVERLEAARLVTTGRDDADRRRVLVKLTATGRALLRRAPAPPTQLLVDGFRAMTPRGRAALVKGLDELVDHLGVRGGVAPMLFEDDAGATRRTGTGKATRR